MSAPETNVDKQTRRHRGPLYGIAAVTAFAVILFLALTAWTAEDGDSAGDEADPAVVAPATN